MITSRKAIEIFGIAAILLLLVLATFTTAASAAELHVGTGQPYATIQAAINAAGPNDIIIVHQGDYKENLLVNKSNIVIRSSNGSSVTFISSNQMDKHVIKIADQTNVTLDGFEIRNASGVYNAVAGIYMENASTCTISNISVTNFSETWETVFYGIRLKDSHNNTFSASTSVSNIRTYEFVYGIALSSSNNNAFNSNISVTNIATNGLDCRAYGILLEDSRNNTFSANTAVSDITSTWFIAYGIYLSDSSNNNIFSASTSISTISAYLRPYGIYLSASSNNAFSSNTTVSAISATLDPYGIYLSDSSNNNTFSASTSVSNLTGDDAYGIYLDSSNHNGFSASTSVSNISATNFAFGILLDSSNNGSFTASTSVSNISARYAFGIYLDSSSNNAFTASTTVSHISATNYAFGIDLVFSNNNRFSTSTTVSNIDGGLDAYGIMLIGSNSNTISEFTITEITSGSGAKSYGIHLVGGTHGNCSGNVFSGGNIYSSGDPRIDYAVWLDNCTHNTINESDILENGHGFWLNQSDCNTIERNTIVNNTALYVSGVYLTSGSDNNELHENCFYDNGLEYQAWDDGMNNDWDYNFWSDYPQWGDYAIAGSADSKDHSTLRECGGLPNIFDTGSPANPYPSLAGMHNGTITPLHDIVNVTTLYTYPCLGTGGHTEYVKIWKGTTSIAEKTWSGYFGEWQTITFDESFTLYAHETYNYTIRTGSYPQIIHNRTLLTDNGRINCTEFTDANGRTYDNWIPAIRLWID